MCSAFKQLAFAREIDDGRSENSVVIAGSVMLPFLCSTEGNCLSKQLVRAAFTQETVIEGQQNSVTIPPLQPCYCFDARLKVTMLPSNLIVNSVTKQIIALFCRGTFTKSVIAT